MSSSNNHSNKYIIGFIIVLCFVCATVLSILATTLKEPQSQAERVFRSKQMLMAAKILNTVDSPSREEIFAIYQKRISPFLVNEKGETSSFEDAGIDKEKFIAGYEKQNKKKLKWKLIYKILPNDGYVIPVSGQGLWDAIHGYIAIANDGNHVIGISWYDQKETPGLGANIAEAKWQKQFFNKEAFQPSEEGETNFQRANLGIVVVKGTVVENLGDSPKSRNAVDGIAGASMTGKGVMDAYKDSLAPYRVFLIGLSKESK